MIFLEILEIIIVICVLLIVVTQFLIPVIKGVRIFPYFIDKSERRLEDELERVKETIAREKLKMEILEEKLVLNNLKNKQKEKQNEN